MSGLALSMATYGVSYICVSIVPWFSLALVFVFLAHIAGGGNWMMSSYALQTEIPDELRGRVLSVDMMIASIAVAISSVAASILESHMSTRLLVACCGSITLLYADRLAPGHAAAERAGAGRDRRQNASVRGCGGQLRPASERSRSSGIPCRP